MADSPNPYAPGKAPDPPPVPGAPVVSWRRIVAVIASVSCFIALGLWVLGRKRRFFMWALPAVLTIVLMVVAGWFALPKLLVVALVGVIVLAVGSLIDTFVAAASAAAPPLGRALVAVLVVFVCGRAALYGVKQWLVESFSIPSANMQPALLAGEHVMVKKSVRDVQRGDMVVFRYPPDPTIQMIDRVVAMAGDTVEIRSNVVRVNGIALPQTPLSQACPRGATESPPATAGFSKSAQATGPTPSCWTGRTMRTAIP